MAVCGRKADVEPHRLLVGRENFAPRVVTMSAGVCVGGKGHVNIVDEKAKILFSLFRVDRNTFRFSEYGQSCYGLRIGNRTQAFQWYHIQ